MFGRKKEQPVQLDPNLEMNQLFADLAVMLYRNVAGGEIGIEVKGALEFDAQQRISNLKNIMANGQPIVPEPSLIEAMNKRIITTLSVLPEIYTLRRLELYINADGSYGATPTYLK